MPSNRANIYEQTTRDERATLQAENIRLIQDAWYKLLLQFNMEEGQSAHEKLTGLKIEVEGSQAEPSLELDIGSYNPAGNLSSELANISVRCRYIDSQGRMKFPVLSNLEISGGPDEQGRVGLTVHARTESGHEGRGLGKGLTSLLRELIPLLLKVHQVEWNKKIVYVVRQDKAASADNSSKGKKLIKRQGWTTSQARDLGFTDDPDYIKRFLGEDFLPLPEKTLVRVYKHPKL